MTSSVRKAATSFNNNVHLFIGPFFAVRSSTSPKCPHHDCDELLTEEDGIKVDIESFTMHLFNYFKILQYFPDRFVRKEVNKLPVSCPNTHRGCDWTGVFGNLESHLRNCAFEQAACKHCDQLIPVHQV